MRQAGLTLIDHDCLTAAHAPLMLRKFFCLTCNIFCNTPSHYEQWWHPLQFVLFEAQSISRIRWLYLAKYVLHLKSPWYINVKSKAIFYDLKKLIIWLYFSENVTLYDQTKMTELERIQLLHKEALPTKIDIRDGSPMVCWTATKTNSSKHEQNTQYVLKFETNWKHAWALVCFLGVARTCIFRQCITFYSNNLVHLRLCQHMQGAQVGSICRMQLRPIDVVVSLIFWDCFNGFLIELIWEYAKYDFMT